MADFLYKIFPLTHHLNHFFIKYFRESVHTALEYILDESNGIKIKIKKIKTITLSAFGGLKHLKKVHFRFAGVECLTLLAVVMSFVFPQHMVKTAFASVNVVNNQGIDIKEYGYSLLLDDALHSLLLEKIDYTLINSDPALYQSNVSQTESPIYYGQFLHTANIDPPIMIHEYLVVATAYSSAMDQTDDTPFVTANGMKVYDGLIATNFLPFGAKVKIPDHYGDKIFTVNDRMNARYEKGRIDIWMSTRNQAQTWGVKKVRLLVIE